MAHGMLRTWLWRSVIGVVAVLTAALVVMLYSFSSPVDRAALRRVKVGMLRVEVESILGPPTRIEEDGRKTVYCKWMGWERVVLNFDGSGQVTRVVDDQ